MELLAPQPGERILDLGCGDGALTRKLADLGCEVVAIDSSAPQIEAARKLGLDAHVMSAEALPFQEEFDAVFSNAVLHWIKRADLMIAAVYRSLKPGGRFVAECGGYGCVHKIRTALVEALERRGIDGEARVPWYFPTPGDYATRLERAGFRVDSSKVDIVRLVFQTETQQRQQVTCRMALVSLGLFLSAAMALVVGSISNSTFRRLASSFTSFMTGSAPVPVPITSFLHFQGIFSSTESGVWPNSSRNFLEGFFLRFDTLPRSIRTSWSYVVPSMRMEPKENFSKRMVNRAESISRCRGLWRLCAHPAL